MKNGSVSIFSWRTGHLGTDHANIISSVLYFFLPFPPSPYLFIFLDITSFLRCCTLTSIPQESFLSLVKNQEKIFFVNSSSLILSLWNFSLSSGLYIIPSLQDPIFFQNLTFFGGIRQDYIVSIEFQSSFWFQSLLVFYRCPFDFSLSASSVILGPWFLFGFVHSILRSFSAQVNICSFYPFQNDWSYHCDFMFY